VDDWRLRSSDRRQNLFEVTETTACRFHGVLIVICILFGGLVAKHGKSKSNCGINVNEPKL